jgi:thioredoxin reductase (NADPH)
MLEKAGVFEAFRHGSCLALRPPPRNEPATLPPVRPILLTVDDDPEVLRAVERDLRRQYGSEYRVLRADAGATALEALRQVDERGDPVALFLVDQRMPRMSGVEFLEQARTLFPEAKRVLLTAYADTEAAIQAINTARVDYYSMKPWDPAEENLYPVLDDLLADWQAHFHPPFQGIRVIGHRLSAESHTLRDFLGRNGIPYQWLDVEANAGEAGALLARAGLDDRKLPVVLFDDGSHLTKPTSREVAEKIGGRVRPERPFYDLVIVGGGPAGLAAAVYGASEGLSTVLVEREAPGGQAGTSSRIENYLGFPAGLSGGDLARRAVAQARRFGVEILSPQDVVGLRVEDPYRTVLLQDGTQLSGHVVLIATGVQYRKLDVPGLDGLTGMGVYYGAAMTEAVSCAGDDVYIVGGANSAGQAAMYFSRYASRVVMLVRGEGLVAGMSKYLIDEIAARTNIEVRSHTQVVEARGETSLEALVLADRETGARETVQAKALFIFIGALPRTDWLDGVVQRDPQGFILSGPDLNRDESGGVPGWTADREPSLLETSVPGIFVAGDVRHRSIKRVASGVGEGSVAVQLIHQYLSKV